MIERSRVSFLRAKSRAIRNIVLRRRWNLLFDLSVSIGDFGQKAIGYRTDIDKEAVSRKYVFDIVPAKRSARPLRFLDVGGRDGKLSYLLGHRAPLEFDREFYGRNKELFSQLYEYFAIDLMPAGDHVLAGDICDREFLSRYGDFRETFDVVYSNNVFEHLEKPWIAAEVLLSLLAPGGICITIVPFSQRYHESPGDFFRYTHSALGKLFTSAGPIEVLETGYDIRARRFNWQGIGTAKDIVPVDRFGAWRETWFTVTVIRKSLGEGL